MEGDLADSGSGSARAWAPAAAAAASRAPTCRSPGVRAPAGRAGGRELGRAAGGGGGESLHTRAAEEGKPPRGSLGRRAPRLQLREDWCARLPQLPPPFAERRELERNPGRGGWGALHSAGSAWSREPRPEAATCLHQRARFQVSLNPLTSPGRRMGFGNTEGGNMRAPGESSFRLAPPSSQSKHFSR